MDGRTDGQCENSIPPTNKVCGGYNKFITTEVLPFVGQFGDQDKVFCMNRNLSHLIKGKLCEI